MRELNVAETNDRLIGRFHLISKNVHIVEAILGTLVSLGCWLYVAAWFDFPDGKIHIGNLLRASPYLLLVLLFLVGIPCYIAFKAGRSEKSAGLAETVWCILLCLSGVLIPVAILHVLLYFRTNQELKSVDSGEN